MRPAFLLLFASTVPLLASTVMVSSGLGAFGGGGFDCNQQSRDRNASLWCSSSYQGHPGFETATADTLSGDGSATASTSVGGFGSASASATAEDDRWLMISSLLANDTLVGVYNCSYSFAPFGVGGPALVQQGDTIVNGCVNGDVRSTAKPGVPFEQRLIISAYSGSPGDDSMRASLSFAGFTDLAGHAVAFVDPPGAPSVVVPEPVTWLLLACGIAVIVAARAAT